VLLLVLLLRPHNILELTPQRLDGAKLVSDLYIQFARTFSPVLAKQSKERGTYSNDTLHVPIQPVDVLED
jgi:hypothetical protein